MSFTQESNNVVINVKKQITPNKEKNETKIYNFF